MSFLYDDPNLIDELIKNALDFDLKFTKHGQAVDKDYNNLNTLLTNLEKAITPVKEDAAAPTANAAPKVSYQADPNNPTAKPSYGASDLEDFESLINFLATKKMTVDGKRIAYNDADPESKAVAQSDEYDIYRTQRTTGGPALSRTKEDVRYYVQKDLLVKFIQSRLAALATKPNKTEEVQLRARIQDANNLLDLNIDPKYKPPADLTKPVDSLPKLFGDVNAPGSEPITLADVQSLTSLNGWLAKHDISVQVDNKPVNIKDRNNFDHCAALKYMYQRGQAQLKFNATPENTKTLQDYLNQLAQIAGSVQGKDGEACDIGAPAAQQQPGAAGGPGQAVLQNLVSGLPLDPDSLNFQRIMAWINEYKKIINSTKNKERKASDMAAINNITASMSQATALTQNKKQDFELSNADSSTVEGWLTPPAAEKYLSLLYHLRTVLEGTNTLLGNFYAAYVRKASPEDRDVFTPEQRSAVEGQILGGGSVYKTNWDDIRALESNPPKVVPVRK
jgi:hypothetical protein